MGEGGGGELRIWNFQRYQGNSMWNFQGLIKSKMKFPKCDQEIWCGNFRGLFLLLEFPRDLTILWNIQGLSFALSGISRSKKAKNSKGKNIIRNQILVSKLWCIGQIYTFPKYQKGNWKKNIQFPLEQEKIKPPRHWAQLSIWKDRLGILLF